MRDKKTKMVFIGKEPYRVVMNNVVHTMAPGESIELPLNKISDKRLRILEPYSVYEEKAEKERDKEKLKALEKRLKELEKEKDE